MKETGRQGAASEVRVIEHTPLPPIREVGATGERPAALLCFEAEAAHCHRRIVAERLGAMDTFEVEDLVP